MSSISPDEAVSTEATQEEGISTPAQQEDKAACTIAAFVRAREPQRERKRAASTIQRRMRRQLHAREEQQAQAQMAWTAAALGVVEQLIAALDADDHSVVGSIVSSNVTLVLDLDGVIASYHGKDDLMRHASRSTNRSARTPTRLELVDGDPRATLVARTATFGTRTDVRMEYRLQAASLAAPSTPTSPARTHPPAAPRPIVTSVKTSFRRRLDTSKPAPAGHAAAVPQEGGDDDEEGAGHEQQTRKRVSFDGHAAQRSTKPERRPDHQISMRSTASLPRLRAGGGARGASQEESMEESGATCMRGSASASTLRSADVRPKQPPVRRASVDLRLPAIKPVIKQEHSRRPQPIPQPTERERAAIATAWPPQWRAQLAKELQTLNGHERAVSKHMARLMIGRSGQAWSRGSEFRTKYLPPMLPPLRVAP